WFLIAFRLSKRRDLFPDILSSLVPADRIARLGPVDLAIAPSQEGSHLCLEVLLQNRLDEETELNLRFGQWRFFNSLTPPSLSVVMPPASVGRAIIAVAMNRFTQTQVLKLPVEGSAKGKG